MNIKWNDEDLEDLEADLTIKRPNGYYSVMNGCDGWIIHTPNGRYVHTIKHGWINTYNVRGDEGTVTRDQAREFAEQLIREYK